MDAVHNAKFFNYIHRSEGSQCQKEKCTSIRSELSKKNKEAERYIHSVAIYETLRNKIFTYQVERTDKVKTTTH